MEHDPLAKNLVNLTDEKTKRFWINDELLYTTKNGCKFRSGKNYEETLLKNVMIPYGWDIQAKDTLKHYWKHFIIGLS